MHSLTPKYDDRQMPNGRGAARYAARKMMQRQARAQSAARRAVARSTAGELALFGALSARSPFHWFGEQPLGDYRADFYCPSARLVVEVDGSSHNHRGAYDRQRDADMAAYGIATLRFTNDQVLCGAWTIVGQINNVCRQRSGCLAERPLISGSTSKPSGWGSFLQGFLGAPKPGRATPGSSTFIPNGPWVRRGKARLPAALLRPPSPSSRATPVRGSTLKDPSMVAERSGLFHCDVCLRVLPKGDMVFFKGVCRACVPYM
jgi:very-short-patch-repair endonuclease